MVVEREEKAEREKRTHVVAWTKSGEISMILRKGMRARREIPQL